jgi:RimJ/RimL family protein N-acetyltransferase
MTTEIRLRDVVDADLDLFFAHQQDREAARMAAFTAKDPSDRSAFDAHWKKIRANAAILIRTVLVDGAVAGHVASWQSDTRELTYWIGREHWRLGVATKALSLFLEVDRARPIQARAAKDNLGSVRVLEKNGFRTIAEERGFANARGAEIDEVVLELG